MADLVLSLFPGIGLLDMAFEEEGFTVVRGPDVLWGGDVRHFHPPAGVFSGVIGGPPCQAFSPLVNINAARGRKAAANLIGEFERCVFEARPHWFLMENVFRAPRPRLGMDFGVNDLIINNRWLGGEQNRIRRFSYGKVGGMILHIDTEALEPFVFEPAVTSSSGGRRAKVVYEADGRSRGKQGTADAHRLRQRSIKEMLALQGLPAGFLEHAPFTDKGKRTVIANGVPLPMGRAIAKAVRLALHLQPKATE